MMLGNYAYQIEQANFGKEKEKLKAATISPTQIFILTRKKLNIQ